ncbi:Ig-like domain-containing protein [Candidatus Palauibacter sp.]|uniref:Ig-like domain-containing protein n=1 Tax=Candidatus Palauibacter sp. TaxID=3101350 RepID=UPI003B524A58
MNRYRMFIFAAATLSAALWAYACGDGTAEPTLPPPPDPARPTTVAVSPANAQLAALGATVQLSAEVRDQNGQAMAGATVTWASSAASVATVSDAGLVTAADNGTATITAMAGSAQSTAQITVAQQVSAVAVTPAVDTLVAGDTLRLVAEATDANGHPVAEVEVSWASSNTLVAAVDSVGLVTGVGAGQAEVTAAAKGVTGRADVTVVAPAPTTVAVTPDTVALAALGQTAQFTAEVRDQAGRAMEGVPVAWSSGDTTVAAVDSAGLVTAVGAGETTITATSGEVSGEAVVTVMQSAGSVVVSPAADTVAPGDTLRLVAEAFDENGHRVEGAQFDWSSSAVLVASVDGSGLVTAVAEGTATITATTGDARGTAEITVENPDRAALVALYNATNGPNWVNNENWLTDAPLKNGSVLISV